MSERCLALYDQVKHRGYSKETLQVRPYSLQLSLHYASFGANSLLSCPRAERDLSRV